MKKLLFTFILFTNLILAQSYEIEGTIKDSETGAPLSYASIRISGTTSGTASNLEGHFTLKIKEKIPTLIFSYVGYKTDTLQINLQKNKKLDISLKPYPVKLDEIIIDGSENPAYRIIREAIKRKEENRRGLKNFEYNAYSKRLVKSAGEIALLEEVFLKGYNKVGEWEKEFVLSYHKTENDKFNQSSSIEISDEYYIDFSRDTLDLLMNKIFLPLAKNTFDYYDYRLVAVSESEIGENYKIKVIPLSKIQPLMEGEITIEGNNYALTSVDLKTNEGVRFPFVTSLSIHFLQQLGQYDGYWLPNYVENKGGFEISFQGLLGLDAIDFKIINNITEYKINTSIPDSVIKLVKVDKYKVNKDTTVKKIVPVKLTREEIKSLRPIPLTESEVHAYETLDSSKTLEKIIKVKGALSGLIPDDYSDPDTSQSLLSTTFNVMGNYLYFSNNRVSEIVLGPKYNGEISKGLSIDVKAGYSFGRKKAEGLFHFSYKPKEFFINNIEASIFHEPKHGRDFTPYKNLFNSAAVTLGFEDQFNYYLATGYTLELSKNWEDKLTTGLEFVSENQKSMEEGKYHSIFNSNRFSRNNPKIVEGLDNSLSLSLLWGKNPNEIQLTPESGLISKLEISNPTLGSDFNYKKIMIKGLLQTETFYNELFIAPYLSINFEAGLLTGGFGPQHLLTPDVALGVYSPQGVLKGLNPYEYNGTGIITLNVEHNWRTTPFQALGLNFISDLFLDFITGASAMKVWDYSDYPSLRNSDKPYWETYIGISKILGAIRVDVGYNSFKDVSVTASLGMIL